MTCFSQVLIMTITQTKFQGHRPKQSVARNVSVLKVTVNLTFDLLTPNSLGITNLLGCMSIPEYHRPRRMLVIRVNASLHKTMNCFYIESYSDLDL